MTKTPHPRVLIAYQYKRPVAVDPGEQDAQPRLCLLSMISKTSQHVIIFKFPGTVQREGVPSSHVRTARLCTLDNIGLDVYRRITRLTHAPPRELVMSLRRAEPHLEVYPHVGDLPIMLDSVSLWGVEFSTRSVCKVSRECSDMLSYGFDDPKTTS